jgi:hypothetical protein
VDRASDKHRGRLIVRVEFRGSARILFGLNESAFAIGARGFVQLILRSDSIDYSAPGASGNEASDNKDRQKENGDPGLSEFHLSVTPIFY